MRCFAPGDVPENARTAFAHFIKTKTGHGSTTLTARCIQRRRSDMGALTAVPFVILIVWACMEEFDD